MAKRFERHKLGAVLPLKLLWNLNSSSPVVYPQPSQPPSHYLAGKSHSVTPLLVCLSYPIHPGHNTQWPGAREATGCPQLKSMPKLSQ